MIEQAQDDISLKEISTKFKDLVGYLFSKWLIIIIAVAIGALIGVGYANLKKINYVATSTFVLEEGEKGSSLGQYAGLASLAGIDLGAGGGGIFQGDNILELYRSRNMIQKTLLSPVEANSKELLIDKYITFNKLREKWKKKPELSRITFKIQDGGKFSRLQDSVLGETVEQINKLYLSVGKPDKKLSIIKVSVKAMDEVFAKSFNDQIVANVNEFYRDIKIKRSRENVRILQRQTDSVRLTMEGSIYNVASTLDQTPNLNPTRQVLRAPVQKSQFSAETNKTILGELVKNLELSKLSLRKDMPLIQVIDQPIFPLDNDKLKWPIGLILGGFFAGFLTVLVLIFKRFIQDI